MMGWGFGNSGGGNPWLQQLSQRLAAFRQGIAARHPQMGGTGMGGWGGWQGGQPGGTPPIIPQQNGFAAGGGGAGGGMGGGMGWGGAANSFAAQGSPWGGMQGRDQRVQGGGDRALATTERAQPTRAYDGNDREPDNDPDDNT